MSLQREQDASSMAKKIALEQLRRISKTRSASKRRDALDGAERRIVPDLPKPEEAD
jgi:hypothetical protein